MFKSIALSVCVTLPWLLAPTHASAQTVYRCMQASGAYEFSDVPCGPTKPSTQLKIQPNSLSHVEEREFQLRKENALLKEQLMLRDQEASISGQPRSSADLRAERVETMECKKARRDYEVTANSRINGYAVIQAKRDSMMVMCGR